MLAGGVLVRLLTRRIHYSVEVTKQDDRSLAIAIFAYRRPKNISKILETLQITGILESTDAFIFCDGARDCEAEEAVARTIEVALQFQDKGLQVVRRQGNLGLSQNIMKGLTYLSERYNGFIVIEDDVLIDGATLVRMKNLLGSDSLGADIGAVNCSLFGSVTSENEWVTSNRFISWGWGTRADIWNSFAEWHKTVELSRDTLLADLPKEWSVFEKWFVGRMYKNFENLDSWAIPFSHFLRVRNYKILNPSSNGLTMLSTAQAANAKWSPLLPRVKSERLMDGLIHESSQKELVQMSRKRFCATILGYAKFKLRL